jgi:hypothetical protein
MSQKSSRGAAASTGIARNAARTLEKIFKDLELDPLQPDHWNRLQNAMVSSGYFGRRPRRGRPKGSTKWNSTALQILAWNWIIAVAENEGPGFAAEMGLWWPYRAHHPRLEKSVALIRKRFPDEYRYDSDRAISRRLREAIRHWKRQREFEAWVREPGPRGLIVPISSLSSDDEIDAEVEQSDTN